MLYACMHAFSNWTYRDVLMFEFRCSVFTGNIHWLLASHTHVSKQQDEDFHIVFLRNRQEIKTRKLTIYIVLGQGYTAK